MQLFKELNNHHHKVHLCSLSQVCLLAHGQLLYFPVIEKNDTEMEEAVRWIIFKGEGCSGSETLSFEKANLTYNVLIYFSLYLDIRSINNVLLNCFVEKNNSKLNFVLLKVCMKKKVLQAKLVCSTVVKFFSDAVNRVCCSCWVTSGTF